MAPQPGIGSSNGISWKLYLFMDHFDDKECNLKGVSCPGVYGPMGLELCSIVSLWFQASVTQLSGEPN